MNSPAVEIPVFVVVPPDVLLLDMAGPVEVLRKANLVQAAVRFTVHFVAPAGQVASSIGLAMTGMAPLPANLPEAALVVVPGSADQPLGPAFTEAGEAARQRAEIVTWLAGQVRPEHRLVSICSGALLSARAGLLDGYDCTTHWGCLDELVRLAPGANVLENRLFVEDRDRLTSAGITAGVDLMLHLVAEAAGPRVALEVARYLVVYLRRAGNDPQLSPWLEGRNHIHPAVHRAQDAVAATPAGDWSVSGLAKVAGTSPRNLSRLFNDHAGMSVTDYVSRMRLALARQLVEGSRLDMESVAERAGFTSARQLRRVWGRFYDCPPNWFRREGGRGAGPAA